MAKQQLTERLQQLAGIKSLHEFYPDDTPDEPGYEGFPGEEEAGMAPRTDEKSLSDGDKRALQVVVGEYSTDEILTYLAVLYDQIGFYDKADMIKKLADQIQDFDPSSGINISPTDLD